MLIISGKYDHYREEDVTATASLSADENAWIGDTASHTSWREDSQRFMPKATPFSTDFDRASSAPY